MTGTNQRRRKYGHRDNDEKDLNDFDIVFFSVLYDIESEV